MWDTRMISHQTLPNPMALVDCVSLERNTRCVLVVMHVHMCMCIHVHVYEYVCFCMCVYVCRTGVVLLSESLRPGSAMLDSGPVVFTLLKRRMLSLSTSNEGGA